VSSPVLPTTRAQVSGHRFLQRRVEHGLVLGDIRMIHDPLGARRRAMIFGLVAVVLIGLGAGLMAWLRPAADPGGDAPILQTADGALFVRVDDTVHPVANLASARLIAGEPAEPARIADHLLAGLNRGAPVGIHPAPTLLAGESGHDPAWSVCSDPDGVTVLAGAETSPLGGHRGVLAVGADRDWVLTTTGRAELPPADSPEGRVIRRALGITADTPRWRPPVEVLTAVTELTPLRPPADLPHALLDTGTQTWAQTPAGITPVTDVQAEILTGMGVRTRTVAPEDTASLADAPAFPGLPAIAPMWVDPQVVTVCVGGDGGTTTLPPELETPAPVLLPGDGIADQFIGLTEGARAVSTGHGHHVIDATGLRHEVPDRAALAALGLPEPVPAPWDIIRLLPEGARLDAEAARTSTH